MSNNLLLYSAFFVLATMSDWLSCLWHQARERDLRVRGMALAMTLEALTWVPIWFALTMEDFMIAVVSIAGSAAGSYLGFSRQRVQTDPVEPAL